MKRKNSSYILFLFISVLLSAVLLCSESTKIRVQPNYVEISDQMNKKTVIPRPPKRAVILYNSFLDLWIRCKGRAAGRVKGKATLPDEALKIPVTGSVGNPNVEKILSLNPDLIILSANMRGHRSLKKLFDNEKIPSLIIRYDNYKDFIRISKLFAVINHSSRETKKTLNKISSGIKQIIRRSKKLPRPKVLTLFLSSSNISCELSNGDTGSIVNLLNGINIVKSNIPGARRVNFSMEKIAEENPDVILIKTMGNIKKCRENLNRNFSPQIWGELKAFKTKRVHFLPKDLFLFKANFRYRESFEYIFRLLYPEYRAK